MATPALGKGLSALLLEDNDPQINTSNNEQQILTLPLKQLRASPYQPRTIFDQTKLDELAESIKENGIIQPIIVRATEREGIYQIIAGERRWRACKQLGLADIPVIIRSVSDQQALALALIENIQRQDLSPIEEAEGYKRLQHECNYTQENLSKIVGRSRSHIGNMMRLLDLPDDVKAHLDSGAISASHARALITSASPSALAEQIIANKLSVRDAEKFAAGHEEPSSAPLKPKKPFSSSRAAKNDFQKQQDLVDIEKSLSHKFGLPVHIEIKPNYNTLTLRFESWTELHHIMALIG